MKRKDHISELSRKTDRREKEKYWRESSTRMSEGCQKNTIKNIRKAPKKNIYMGVLGIANIHTSKARKSYKLDTLGRRIHSENRKKRNFL